MNKITKILGKILVGVMFFFIILSFVFWGIGDIFRDQDQSREVAEIAGKLTLTSDEYRSQLLRNFQQMQRQYGTGITFETFQQLGVPQQVLKSAITKKQYEVETTDLGLRVSEDQLRDRIFSDTSFQDATGQFDRFQFQQALRLLAVDESGYLELLREEIKRQHLIDILTASLGAPDPVVNALVKYDGQKRKGDFVILSNDQQAAPPEPDDETLQSYYETIVQRFQTSERRDLRFVLLDPKALEERVVVSQEGLKAEYEARLDEFTTPEQRAAKQILVDSKDEAEQVKTLMESGKSFEEAAQEVTGDAPLSLGLQSQSDVLPELSNSLFSLDVGATSEPIESPFGWHILKVSEVLYSEVKSFEDVRSDLEASLREDRAIDVLVELTNILDDRLAAGDTLEDAATAAGLEVLSLLKINRSGENEAGEKPATLPSSPEFLSVAFELSEGEVSLLEETGDGGYFIAAVDTIHPAMPKAFVDVKGEVLAAWNKEQIAQSAKNAADDLVKAMQGSDKTLQQIAEEQGLEVQQLDFIARIGQADSDLKTSVKTAIFEDSLEIGEVTVFPIEGGFGVAQLTDIQQADDTFLADNTDSTKNILHTTLANETVSLYQNLLEIRYPVEIYPEQVEAVQLNQ